ncbi:MAG: hypothetical protein ACKOAD_05025 [Gammaproteobacteria bacterium]
MQNWLGLVEEFLKQGYKVKTHAVEDLVFPEQGIADFKINEAKKEVIIKARFGGLLGQDSPLPGYWLQLA